MTRDPRHDILFEPVKIGPVEAKNRFYQVPHCTGSGWRHPRILAGLRGMKAEGGWAVVNTEYCSVHPSCDDPPHACASLWDEGDVKAHALMTEKVHAHGALAGVELCLGGAAIANLSSRDPALGVGSTPNTAGNPFQTRAMDKSDIREVRRWHRDAALRARRAGFDLVYVYATHGYLLSQFLSKTHNTRIDEYGGSLENRVRLIREIVEDAKEAVGDTMAVAVRLSAETNGGGGGDGNPVPRRDRGRLRRPGRTSRSVGHEHRRLRLRDGTLALHAAGSAGALRRRDQGADRQARGLGRPFHVARRDGEPGPARDSRFHRRGAALDRRPFPPEEDRGGPPRRHPGVHRLQHLLRRRRQGLPDPLHPEPDDERGVAARLASRAHRAQGVRFPTC